MELKFELEDELWWKANVILQSWIGFQSRGGDYGSIDSSRASDGKVKLVFAPEGRDIEPLTKEELKSVEWCLEKETEISESLLKSLLEKYPAMQYEYGYSKQEKSKYMPDVATTTDFKSLIGLHSVNIHPLTKKDIPYIGLEFGCNWDEEHGLGVLMHGTKVVEVGGADTAILLWVAERDAKEP